MICARRRDRPHPEGQQQRLLPGLRAVVDGLVAVRDQRRPAGVHPQGDRAAQAPPGVPPPPVLRGQADPHRRPGPRHRLAHPGRHGDDTGGLGFGLRKCVAVFLNGEAIHAPNERGERVVDDSFLLCFNAHDEAHGFRRPARRLRQGVDRRSGHRRPDRATPTVVVEAGEKISLQPRSLLVLRKTA